MQISTNISEAVIYPHETLTDSGYNYLPILNPYHSRMYRFNRYSFRTTYSYACSKHLYSIGLESNENITTGSAESTVYVSDLNLKDEWIQGSNTGSSSVSLSGWKIEDEGNKHTYAFPSYTLNAESTLTLFTGKGTNSAAELYWQLDDPILNNDCDTAYLYDGSRKLISKMEKRKWEASKLLLIA